VSGSTEPARRWRRLWPGAAVLAAVVVVGAASATPRGDTRRGKELYDKQCLVCHAVTPRFHKEGPSLSGIYGRKAGTVPLFTGYRSLRGSQVVWNDETLDRWLADPRSFGDGRDTKMILRIDDPQQRADLVAYMATLR
jgi:cytochrome c2